MPTRRLSGFTLLELLVVLAISGAVVALALPRLSGLSALITLNAGARELASALRAARGLAIARHREVAVIVDARARSYRTAGVQGIGRLPAGLQLSLEADTIRFFPDGSSTGARIRISGAQRSYVVEVAWLTGRIAIHD